MAVSLEWQHTRSVLRQTYNKEVLRYFGDLPQDEDPDNKTGRASMKRACLILGTDGMMIAQIKMTNFFNFIKRAHDRPAVYGIPIHTYSQELKYFPQVQLHFREKTSEAKAKDRYPIRAQVGFRIMDKNFSKSEAKALAEKIKAKFATPIIHFRKGKTKISYIDQEKGYHFTFAVDEEAEAKKIINLTLDLQDHEPNWSLLNDSNSNRSWTKETKVILGQTIEMPTQRPIGNVYFTHAELKIHGLTKDIILCDATASHPGALAVV